MTLIQRTSETTKSRFDSHGATEHSGFQFSYQQDRKQLLWLGFKMCVRPDAESWRQYKQLFETKLKIKPGNIGIKITLKRIATIYFWSNQLNEIRIYNDCFSSHTCRSPVIKNNSETKHEKRIKYPVLVRVLQRNRTNKMIYKANYNKELVHTIMEIGKSQDLQHGDPGEPMCNSNLKTNRLKTQCFNSCSKTRRKLKS